jgi:RNA polymerase sigma-70 factor (ECF subfamily)
VQNKAIATAAVSGTQAGRFVDQDARAKQEASLVRRLQERDPAALGDLYDQFGTTVYRAALRIVRNVPAAEDLTQETFLWIWNRIGAFDAARGTLACWIGMVARSRAIDYARTAEFRVARNSGEFKDTAGSMDAGALSRLFHRDRIRLLAGDDQDVDAQRPPVSASCAGRCGCTVT